MAEIRAVDCIEPRPEGIALAVERPRRDAIVAFAAKEEIRHKPVVNILGLFDAAVTPFVPFRRVATAAALELGKEQLAVETAPGEVAVFAAEPAVQLTIDVLRIHVVEGLQITLVPALIERAVEAD